MDEPVPPPLEAPAEDLRASPSSRLLLAFLGILWLVSVAASLRPCPGHILPSVCVSNISLIRTLVMGFRVPVDSPG